MLSYFYYFYQSNYIMDTKFKLPKPISTPKKTSIKINNKEGKTKSSLDKSLNKQFNIFKPTDNEKPTNLNKKTGSQLKVVKEELKDNRTITQRLAENIPFEYGQIIKPIMELIKNNHDVFNSKDDVRHKSLATKILEHEGSIKGDSSSINLNKNDITDKLLKNKEVEAFDTLYLFFSIINSFEDKLIDQIEDDSNLNSQIKSILEKKDLEESRIKKLIAEQIQIKSNIESQTKSKLTLQASTLESVIICEKQKADEQVKDLRISNNNLLFQLARQEEIINKNCVKNWHKRLAFVLGAVCGIIIYLILFCIF